MNFSAWSIRNPVPAILLFILLTGVGLLGFQKLGIQHFPDMDMPTITVSASLEGAAPAQLETEVARKIEDKLASLTLLDHVTTTITDGAVSLSVTFDIDKDVDEALNEVRDAVTSVKGDLPSAMATPTVTKVTAASSALLTFVARSDKLSEEELSWLVDNDATKAILSVKGVAKVSRLGGVDREAHVDLDPARMAGLGVDAATVSTAIKATREDGSAGRAQIGTERQSVRVAAASRSLEDLAATVISLSGGRDIRLDQIATISDSVAERASAAYFNGEPVIAFQIKRSKGFSDVTVAKGVREAVSTFATAHPEASFEEVGEAVTPIEENYEGSMNLLYEGAGLAVLVVFLFLRDWRATILAATALPLSIIPTFAAMNELGFSLNIISLLALALVVGILVDDAIVEIENISRHARMGKTPYQAAMEAADEIGLAVIATTLTMVAVFLPTAFMGGISGRIFRQFGLTASVAVLASLLVARLLTPMMAAYCLKPTKTVERADGWIMRTYLGLARACLGRPWRTTFAALLFLIGSVSLIPLLPTGFFPAQDDGQTRATLTLQPGTTLDETSAMVVRATEIVRGIPEVRRVFASVGTSSSGGGPDAVSTSDSASATISIDLKARSERSRKQSAVEADIRNALAVLPGARVEVGRGGNGEQLQITLASDDPDSLAQVANAAETELRTLRGVGNVVSSAARQQPEIQIRPDFARAATMGVTSEALASTIRVATNGEYSSSMPKINLPQRQISVRVRVDPKVKTDIDAIKQLRVAATGGYVTLGSISSIEFGGADAQIDRLDRARSVTLTVELNGRALGEAMREAMELSSLKNLPQGVHTVQQGETQRMSEMFSSFATAIAIGIFCIYSVLVLLFHDFLQPATILAALPLAIGGALVALLTMSMSFSMPAVIGVLMLMGIVTKNSILLVEYAITARRRGMDRFEALIDACRKRARPIVMTTIAMGMGMMPVAAGMGADPSFRQPMGVIVIGGLLTSTVLSLVVVPVIFTLVDDFARAVGRLFRGGATDTQAFAPVVARSIPE